MLRGKWWRSSNRTERSKSNSISITKLSSRPTRTSWLPRLREPAPVFSDRYHLPAIAGPPQIRRPFGQRPRRRQVATFTGQQAPFTLPVDIARRRTFGKVRNTVREFRYGTAQRGDLENQRLIEQASLSQIFFEIRGQDELQVLNATVEAAGARLTRARYETGIDNDCRWFRLKLPGSVRARAINIGLARAQFEYHRHTDRQASSLLHPGRETTPPPIPVGVPRHYWAASDIAAAERAMAEANAQIGIAYAAF